MAFALRGSLAAIRRVVGARNITIDAKAVRYEKHGHPTAVLKLQNIKLDTANVKAGDVLVKMVASPITPADLAQVTGFAGASPSFPRVGGNEGLGVVQEAGASSGLKKGDVVVASKGGVGTWSTHVIASGDSFTKVEGVDVTKAGVFEAVSAAVVPVTMATRMLDGVSKGDVVIQNGASSTVAQAVIQVAASKGIRTLNIARQGPDWTKLVSHLQSLGAATVVSEAQAGRHEFKKILADLGTPKLALNATGGAVAGVVARALGNGGTLVTYGSSTGRPVNVSLDLFLHKNVTLKGFNVQTYVNSLSKQDRDTAARSAVSAVNGGSVKLMVAREPFADFSVALGRTLQPYQRKVVLVF